MSEAEPTYGKPDDPEGGSQSNELEALLEQRRTIEGWLARLDEQRSSASERVLGKVRADYDQRLKKTLESLTRHKADIVERLAVARTDLELATQAGEEANEVLEEQELRHTIGELSNEEWESARDTLQEKAIRAATDRERAEAKIKQLQELHAQMSEADSPQPSAFHTEDPDEQTREFPEIRETPRPPSLTGFLSEIDRALSDEAQSDETDVEDSEATKPKPGLKCPDCGYTNDRDAWFCGVCGADIG